MTGVSATAREGQVDVSFRLSCSRGRELGVSLELSEDGGQTYRPGSSAAPRFTAGREPSVHVIPWDASRDLAEVPQHDLRIRLTPFDPASGLKGNGAESGIFGIGTDSLPRVVRLSAPPGALGGAVPITVELTDGEADHVVLEAQFALPGGRFSDATIEEAQMMMATSGPGGAARAVIHWDARADIPDSSLSGVRFRVRARDTAPGEFAEAGPLEVITIRPGIAALSIEEIEEEMNGAAPFLNRSGAAESFELLVPPWGFAITVALEPGRGGADVDLSSLSVASSRPLGRAGSQARREEGADLGPLFAYDAERRRFSWMVPAELALPEGEVTLTAAVADVLGNPSEPRSFAFTVAAEGKVAAPLEDEDEWLLDFGRDNFSIRSSDGADGRLRIESEEGPDGIPDYEQDLALLGLLRPGTGDGSGGGVLGRRVLELTRETIRGHLYAFYGRGPDGALDEAETGGGAAASAAGANLRFHLAPPGAPCSRLAVGGDDPLPGYTVGRAEFDRGNARRDDDTAADLGVFTTNIIDFHVNASYVFRSRFDPFIPGRGVPLGGDPLDAVVLSDSFDRSDALNDPAADLRYDRLIDAVDAWARMVALVAAHEIGHSLGLAANGPPPRGLFGGEVNASFAGPFTNAFHLDGPGNDIMAAALSFSDALLEGEAGPRFARLHRAYLLGRVLLR